MSLQNFKRNQQVKEFVQEEYGFAEVDRIIRMDYYYSMLLIIIMFLGIYMQVAHIWGANNFTSKGTVITTPFHILFGLFLFQKLPKS